MRPNARRVSRRGPPRTAPEPPGPEAALEIALRYLGSRPRTRWELIRRLRQAGAEQSVVDHTLDRLESLGYVDDAAFVRWWTEQRDRHGPRGRRMIESELRAHGVPPDLIAQLRDHTAERHTDDPLPVTELERAVAAMQRHLRGRPLPEDPRALQRIGAFLVRRGFDPETVRGALRAASRGESAEDD